MAGAGAKLFNSGDVLTAAQVNTFLMDQTIMTFASTSARDAAFGGAGEPTLAEGMFAYTTDTNTLWLYTGSAWQNVLGSNIGEFQLGSRNKIINGSLDVWQRGTSFSNPASGAFTADRMFVLYDGSGATRTVSQGQFDPALPGASITATPPTGTSPTYFLRWNQSVAGTGATYNILYANRIEDVRILAGRTLTLSFYAKAGASITMPKIDFEQSFGAGGSPSLNVYTDVTTNVAVTTSWQRFSFTFTAPSASGKTMGTSLNSSYSSIRLWLPINATFTYDIWGIQLEYGSVATPFEIEDFSDTLAKCQRYYQRMTSSTAYGLFGYGSAASTTAVNIGVDFFCPMRVAPTSFEISNVGAGDGVAGVLAPSATTMPHTSNRTALLLMTVTGATQYRFYFGIANNNAAGYLGFSAEL